MRTGNSQGVEVCGGMWRCPMPSAPHPRQILHRHSRESGNPFFGAGWIPASAGMTWREWVCATGPHALLHHFASPDGRRPSWGPARCPPRCDCACSAWVPTLRPGQQNVAWAARAGVFRRSGLWSFVAVRVRCVVAGLRKSFRMWCSVVFCGGAGNSSGCKVLSCSVRVKGGGQGQLSSERG